MTKRKGKLNIRNLFHAILGGVALLIFLLAALLFLYLILIGEGGVILSALLILDILFLVLLWHGRESFFGRMRIHADGITNRCLGKRTLFVPWEEIESIRYGSYGRIDVIRLESKADNADGFDITLNEENIELLKEHLPQRLKDMLGPRAFE